jgi:hypothetical protein
LLSFFRVSVWARPTGVSRKSAWQVATQSGRLLSPQQDSSSYIKLIRRNSRWN